MTALDPDIRGADRVREVFARVRNGDPRVADLYAEDGVLVAGKHQVEGREAIRAFYQRTIEGIHPQPDVRKVLESPPFYIAVVDVPTTAGHQHATDLFELGEEGIRRLIIFSDPT